VKKITVKDIAELSGYSVSTVSKALNGTDRVGIEAIKKIKQIAEECGYRSSFSAQSLARKSRKVAIVLYHEPREIRTMFEEGFASAFDLYGEFGYAQPGLSHEGGHFASQVFASHYHWLPWVTYVEIDPLSRLYDTFGAYDIAGADQLDPREREMRNRIYDDYWR